MQENYAATDSADGRRYPTFEDGERSYFPTRVPKTLRFDIDAQYARYQRFRPKAIKGIIDEIDGVLAMHYGFTDEELDFIINYDIPTATTRTTWRRIGAACTGGCGGSPSIWTRPTTGRMARNSSRCSTGTTTVGAICRCSRS